MSLKCTTGHNAAAALWVAMDKMTFLNYSSKGTDILERWITLIALARQQQIKTKSFF